MKAPYESSKYKPRDLEYWFPILLPILIGLASASAYWVVEHLSEHWRERGRSQAMSDMRATSDTKQHTSKLTSKTSLEAAAASRPGFGSDRGPATTARSVKKSEVEHSVVLAVVLREVNDALVIGILAAYCHILIVLMPLVESRRLRTGVLYWLLFGLLVHFPFIFAVPAGHKMENLEISSGLSIMAFAMAVFVRDTVWRKYEREFTDSLTVEKRHG